MQNATQNQMENVINTGINWKNFGQVLLIGLKMSLINFTKLLKTKNTTHWVQSTLPF